MTVTLPTTFDEPVLLGVIGGTGLYHLESLTPVARLTISTPWGHPSSPITISRTKTGFPIAFLARHGVHHQFNPTEVPARANIAALKSIGVRAIIAFSAVGSLREHIRPRDFVLPTQIIDRTKGIRPSTFFESGMVGHVGFGDPFDETLAAVIAKAAPVLESNGVKLHTKATEGSDLTLVCMEGPAFSTRAESHMYRNFGASVINMSCIPEAKLAKEAEICYQMICMSTDYDAWREGEEAVTVETVVGHLKANSQNAHNFTEAILEHLEEEITAGTVGRSLEGSMKYSVSTAPSQISRPMLEKMHFLLPGYWSLE
ncbi:nucleoside phosphorylase domain-containing protein [Lipomyces tetrasporus]|uniref:S-methyl-5'-thioadenosine phosphorylase n=1 Tax=Lipomyces tetrasporus TaxID=54092 RepID=A0AAD7QQ95_9ASCO|nr:nucleoside phosphorylase domain-containing protein [Lipomyces tetrasporus]KAJ8099255.1 nucleoside phosphorylase domain-containing protein [Lipomyces tetrasporus]